MRYYDGELHHAPIRIAAYSVFDAQEVPLFTVLSAETLVKRKALVQNILITVILPQIVIITFAALLLMYGVRRGLIPLFRLTDAVMRRGHRDLSVIDEVRSPEEVRPLIHAINELMSRLSVVLAAQERFIADAAHQLRTPLAGLSAQVDRALSERHLDGIRPALEYIKASSRQVTRLVNQLLTLARAEPNTSLHDGFGQVDLAGLVRSTTMGWVPMALAQGTDLGYVGPADAVYVEGDPLLLRELLNNLIDNALRYGNRNGTVTVLLDATPAVALEVEDDGPGIPEPYRKRIFERFYRVPGTASGGCGLGLAIVRQIAEAHKASVSLRQQRTTRGTLFRVEFAGTHRHGAVPPRPDSRTARLEGANPASRIGGPRQRASHR